ncbi:hypothetical protein, partial [Pseudomonas aeruginosa]
DETAQVALSQLRRWTDGGNQARWIDATKKKARDISDNSSKFFFTDQELWLIGVYAELAGVLAARTDLRAALLTDEKTVAHHRQALRTLLNFFQSRLTFREVNSAWTGKTQAAELDRGYWRFYSDNNYAGYTGEQKPVVCSVQPERKSLAELKVAPKEISAVPTLGWDLSHTRRLVHVLEALESNRSAISKVFGLSEEELPNPKLAQFFAAQLVTMVWNGDTIQPLFTNYWNGANGWYRVAYSNGMNRCIEGYPPSGLSDAFPTGGYPTWGRFYPVIIRIGLSVLDVTSAPTWTTAQEVYVHRYYQLLTAQAPPNARMTNRLMFWPSLVGVR